MQSLPVAGASFILDGIGAALHYYQHHIGDFIRDTANLNDHQLATYLRMIWAYYDTEQPFTDSFEDIAFAMRSDEKTIGLLMRRYFKESPHGWLQVRCEKVITGYKGKSEKARNSASARWNNANAMRTHSERNANERVSDANQEPRTNNQKKEEKKSASAPTIPEIPDSLMADFLKVRKAKKAPLTETAIEGIRREAEKSGLSMVDAITVCVERNWQGFRADWYALRQASHTPRQTAPLESFAERDARAKREAWEQMSGRPWPMQDLPVSARSEIIEMEATEIRRVN